MAKQDKFPMVVGGLLVAFLVGVWSVFQSPPRQDLASQTPDSHPALATDIYISQIQPIFNARCVACHACYNSPCQLDLTSYEGLRRGAFKLDTYDFPLVQERRPTRLGIDGKSVKDWRNLGFFPVVSEGKTILGKDSILWTLVNMQGRGFERQAENWDATASRSCPNSMLSARDLTDSLNKSELDLYQTQHPFRGMPYGLPPLNDSQLSVIGEWIQAGAFGPSEKAQAALTSPDPEVLPLITKFEIFFNASDFKSRLSARYIYEHLFLAHIYFEEKPGSFYRLVRARNSAGEPDEIATVRPFDDPGAPFFYRLKKYTATLVHKNHIPYAFSVRRLETWKKRFLSSSWLDANEKWPAYGEPGANPFLTFQAIPAEARYRFMLDDAHYHTMTFIKGPVCNGAVAVSVIDDHFWVLFMDPAKDVTVTDANFLRQNADLMSLPANFPDNEVRIDRIRQNNATVNRNKYALYRQSFPQGLDLSSVWDGDGFNNNALLTIYRHHDSATVLRGAYGIMPKTVWVLDYPIFEDIYYNLVAGYNVYGPVWHQITTRLHMDHSRVDAQDLFLSFLPESRRMAIRHEWTQPPPKTSSKLDSLFSKLQQKTLYKKMNVEASYFGADFSTQKKYSTQDEKSELLHEVFSQRLNARVRGPQDGINCCGPISEKDMPPRLDDFVDVEKWFSLLSRRPASFSVYLPDAGYVRVTLPNGKMKAYTLIHNKEHYNVSFMFLEDLRRNPALDSVDLLPVYGASYPNIYFDLRAEDVPEFVHDLQALHGDQQSWRQLTSKFAVLRSSNRFWEFHDWLNQNFRSVDPIEGARLDLNRYLGDQ